MSIHDTTSDDRPDCALRGFCGPFTFGGESVDAESRVLAGVALCIHCRSPARIETELEKWEAALADRVYDPNCGCSGTIG